MRRPSNRRREDRLLSGRTERARRNALRFGSLHVEQLESRLMLTGLSQWAGSVLDFSSQWSTSGWSAQQAVGEPNVVSYGDYANAWSPLAQNGTTEQITVGFGTPVYADGVTIRETWGNGFVTQVEVRNASTSNFQVVWAGVDPSLPGSPVDFLVSFTQRTYLVDAVRITTNTNHSPVWEQIDAIALRGSTGLDTTPPAANLADPPAGSSISPFVLNDRGYLDVTFSDTGGSGVNVSTITDSAQEFILTGAAASGVTVNGAATLVGGSTYRYSFAGSFGTGQVTVAYVAGSFADNAGNANVAATQKFVVEVGSQWASRVIDVSSQWSSTGWSAQQALGTPNVFSYGDFSNAWSPAAQNGTTEWITLGYDVPVFADGVTVRETWGNGFVTRVEVRNAATRNFEVVWAGVDPSLPGSPAEFLVSFPQRTYLVDAVRITTDTNHSSVWEQIDAVALHGGTGIVTESPTANLSDPTNGGMITEFVLNGRGYIEVTFADNSGKGLNTSTITDTGQEFRLVGTPASGVTVDGAATLVSGSTYRYSFTGSFGGGEVIVEFDANAFADNTGSSNLATTQKFRVTTNRNPVAVDDLYTTNQDTPLLVFGTQFGTLLRNDSDPDGDALVVSAVDKQNLPGGPALKGTLFWTSAGAFLYDPRGAFGNLIEPYADRFRYTIDDGNGGMATATATIWVMPQVSAANRPVAQLADPANGGLIQQSVLNGRGYIHVTFTDNTGTGLDTSSIEDPGLEFSLGGTAASGVTLNGAAVLVSGTTYRYGFTGNFGVGEVVVEFAADSFSDNGGNTNLAKSQSFTIQIGALPPTADLVNPANGASTSQSSLNSRGYIDVMFSDNSGTGLNASSITDATPEFTLGGAAASGVTVNGAATLVSGRTYRYSFTGSFAPGEVTVAFVAGSFADSSGNTNLAASRSFVVELGSQWASSVIDFSSQWGSSGWSAQQAVGDPNVFAYGDFSGAWSPLARNGTTESITVGYDVPMLADGVTIRETWGNGFVRQVEVRNASTGNFEVVWVGIDPSLPGSPADFLVSFAQRTYSVDAVRITIDTNHSNVWEQIDAIALHGVTG